MGDEGRTETTTGWSRRSFIAATGIVGAAAVVPVSPAEASRLEGRGPRQVFGSFRHPDSRYRARFRWWWPCGNVTTAEVAREVDQAADAGFGGLEIADVHHSIAKSDLDPGGHGWATAPWIAAVKAALRQASRRGITIDLTIGPSWPAAVPSVDPDDEAAACELAHGLVLLAPGDSFDDVVPPAAFEAEEGVERETFVGVHAAKVIAPPSRPGQPSTLDQASFVDLTSSVDNGRLAWTPPDSGDWMVMSYWRRGSGQEPEAGPHTTPTAYVVDHFSAAGTSAVKTFWEERILDREMRRLIKRAGNTLFEDSLEIETDATIWTPRLLKEFEERAGYDLVPYLPVIVEQKEKYLYNYESVLTNQVRDDVAQVLSDLYAENHLLPLRRWAHDLGLELRVQGYGLETDSIYEAALFDQPESESLGFKNLDDYRALSGGRDMGGRTILSCESAAYANGAYNTTWNKVLQTLGSIYAGGVNQAVLHGFSYADAPGAAWPGFAAFSPYYHDTIGYGEAWGPRQPMWRHARDVADHLARTQYCLQAGVNKADIAWFRQKGWTATGIGVGWGTSEAIPIGWSYGFVSGPLLSLDSATIKDGRLAPDGPAYGAIVIEGDRFRSNATTLSVDAAAEQLDRLSRRGLPLVFVGDWSAAGVTGLPAPGEDARLQHLVARMTGRSNVRVAATSEDVPGALAEVGVERKVVHDSSSLMHVHRHVAGRRRGDDSLDLYYLANARHAENRKITRVEQDVWLTASDHHAVPYTLDTWTGEVEPIARYERDGDRVKVAVALNPAESTVVALAPPTDHRRTPVVSSTDADSVLRIGGGVALRASAPGVYTTTFANRPATRTTVDALPDPVALTSWDLVVEDWRPGRGAASNTDVATFQTHMDGLTPWTEVPDLQDISGIGRYRATIHLDGSWRGVEAYLDLGSVYDTFRVFVNRRRVPAQSPLNPRVDLFGALDRGRNTIEIEAPTTLFNRLRVVNPTVFGSSGRQVYGLTGPVVLTPYRQELVRR